MEMDFVLTFPEQLGLHLKSLRKAAGLSQAELATLLGVSQSRVAAIEKDPAAVSLGQFMAILKLLQAKLVIRQEHPAPQQNSVTAESVDRQAPTAPIPPDLGSYKPSPLNSVALARKALGMTAADIAKRQVQKNTPLRPQELPVDWQNKKPKGSW